MNRIEDIVNQLNNKERMKKIYELEMERREKIEEEIRKKKEQREANRYARRKYFMNKRKNKNNI